MIMSENKLVFTGFDAKKLYYKIGEDILLDLRNLYDQTALKSLGFIYEGVGRK